ALLTVVTAGRTHADLLLQDNPPAAQAGDQPPQNQDMDVLARGPIHEAYAEPVNPSPRATPVVPKEPPAPINEVPPDQKPQGENVQWFPGYWFWDEDRSDFIWVSGVWRVPPPGRNWVPGHWAQVEGGWQWTPGFWMDVQATSTQADDNVDNSVQYLPPPPVPLQAAPSTPAPDDQSVYIPGNWISRDTRYVWRPGFWLGFRPG